MASVVMVVSAANVWTMKNSQPHPTGFWSEEFVTPHREFAEAEFKITVASPGGVTPTVDPLSFNLVYNSNDENKVSEQQDYMKHLGPSLTSPMRVEDINPDQFDAIFLVGGHGPMQDMAVHSTIGRVLVSMLDNPKKSSRPSAMAPPVSSLHRMERGLSRIDNLRASAMRKRHKRDSPAMRLGS
jgi:aldehyde dehydrogenase (NAD+)